MRKINGVSKTYRVKLTLEEHKAFAIWCINNDMTASDCITAFLREVIGSTKLSDTRMAPFEKAVCVELERIANQVTRNGWPDFGATLVDGRHVFLEVKSGVDKVRPHQLRTMNWLTSIGFPCYVLYVDGKNKGLCKIIDGEITPVEYSEIAFDETIFTNDTFDA